MEKPQFNKQRGHAGGDAVTAAWITSTVGPLISAAAAVLSAFILVKAWNLEDFFARHRPSPLVVLVGSGTATDYLASHTTILKGHPQRVMALQTGTYQGAATFGEANQEGKEPPPVPVLALAARRLEPKDFHRLADEAFLELELDSIPLRVTLGARSSADLRKVFGAIASRGSAGMSTITAEELRGIITREQPWRSRNLGYAVYVPGATSGTKSLLTEILLDTGGAMFRLPSDSLDWDLRLHWFDSEKVPWVAVGEPEKPEDVESRVRRGTAVSLLVTDRHGATVYRPLFIYARLERDPHHGTRKLAIDPETSRFLRRVLEQLDEHDAGLDVARQMTALHLREHDGREGYVEEDDSLDGVIYGLYRREMALPQAK